MNYIYCPLYKYIAFTIIFFMFLRYYKVITQPNYLIITLVAVLIFILLDYFLIYNHPNIISQNNDYDRTQEALDRIIETETEESDNFF